MKELRELYEISKQENWIPDSHDNHIYAQSDKCMLRVATVTRLADARLIAAMHNALPELLDAWEMVQKLDKWAKDQNGIYDNVMRGGYQYAQFNVEGMIRQWRDAHADTKTD